MGLTNSNFPSTIRVDLNVAFSKGMDTGSDDTYLQLIEVIPVRGTAKQEVFYGDKKTLIRFRTERQPQTFREYKQLITLDDWEMTETVPKDMLTDIPEEARPALLRSKVGNFGNVVATSKEQQFWEFLHNGTSITGFDGDNFFSFSHTYTDSSGDTVSGITQSNMELGGSQFNATTLQLEQQHYTDLRTDTNKPWKGKLTHVAVYRGSQNAVNAKELANSQFTVEVATVKGANTANVFQGAYSLIEFDYGFGASEWLSFDLSRADMKPVKVLSHEMNGFNNGEFSQQTEGSHEDFWRRDWAFGFFGRWDYNPGYWQTARLHGSSGYTYTPDDLSRQRINFPNA